MLHKVSQPLFSFLLVARTRIHRKACIGNLRWDKLVYHAQPVGQYMCRIIGHTRNFTRQKYDNKTTVGKEKQREVQKFGKEKKIHEKKYVPS